jgi:hypothetical protein
MDAPLSTEGAPRHRPARRDQETKGRIEMTHNLKTLALALLAMLAMGAMTASAASALPELTAGEHGKVVGEPVGVMESTIGSRALTCSEVSFLASNLQTSQTTLTVTPDYRKCTTTPVFGIVLHLTVTMNGCDYLFHMTGIDGATYTASVDLTCPAGKLVELHLYKNAAHTEEACTMTTGPQTGKTINEVTNVPGSPNDLLIHHDLTMTTAIDGSAVLCGSGTSTTVEGTSTLRAFNTAGAQVGLTVSGS